MMAVYLIHVPSLDLCKVGYAVSPKARYEHGRAFIPAPSILSAQREGSKLLEAAIHEAALRFHKHGEWFSNFTEVSSIFHSVSEPARVVPTNSAMLEKWSIVESVAKSIGATEANITKWKQRGAVAATWHIKLIIASNGQLTAADFMESGEAV